MLYAATAFLDRNFFTPTKNNVGMPSIAKNLPVIDATSTEVPSIGNTISIGPNKKNNIPRIWYADLRILLSVNSRNFGLWYNPAIISIAVISAITIGEIPFIELSLIFQFLSISHYLIY